jgi:condensin complex subunit 1
MSVKDGVKKMLHLIWKKDDSATAEDKELKGVRQRLLEVYRNLYFEAVEGLDARGQVSRIAKNIIESVNNSWPRVREV